jgi:uncharacterized membrane protein YczE
VRGGLAGRLAVLLVGLFVCGLGIVLFLQAHLGLAPWDVLHQGIANHTPLSFGWANVAVGVSVLLLAWRLGARPGFGTVANAVLIGMFIQLLTATRALPDLAGAAYAARLGYLALGLLAFGVGTALYIGAGMGAGPRDGLMLAVSRRTRARVAVARASTELAALGCGVALGGSVGLGTAVFALGIGPAVELAFTLLARSPLAQAAARPAAVPDPEPAITPP